MATATSFFLQPPNTDDMDVSLSPTNYDDIDIDLDLDDNAVTHNDEQMVDDGEERLTNVDDEMHDDQYNTAHDQVARPTAPVSTVVQDDDLIDYSDDEDVQVEPQSTVETAAIPSEELPTDHTEAHSQDEGPILEFEEHDDLTEAGVENDDVAEEADTKSKDAAQNDAERNELEDHHAEFADVEAEEPTQDRVDEEHDIPLENSTDIAQLDTTAVSVASPVDAPGTPTDTGLHPVLFYYEDATYPLFKSKSSPDGLLKDDNLVSVSLADLIKHCRQRLVIKTDRDIDDAYEVLLTFDNLHLAVFEDSPASFQTSLKDVLDTYVQLMLNDGIDQHDIPALEISCNLQMKFNTSIMTLQKAAANGDGLSTLLRAESFEDNEQNDDIQHDDLNEADVDDDTAAAEATLADTEHDADYDDEAAQAAFEREHYGEESDHNGEYDEDEVNGRQPDEAVEEEANHEDGTKENYQNGLEEYGNSEEVDTALDGQAEQLDGDLVDSAPTAEPDSQADNNAAHNLINTNDTARGGTQHDSAHESNTVEGQPDEATPSEGKTADVSVPASGNVTDLGNADAVDSTTTAPHYDPEDELIDYSDDEEVAITDTTAKVPASNKGLTPTKRGRDSTEDGLSLANKKHRAS